MRKLILTSIATLVVTATFASSAMAANPFFCQQYAQKAVWAEQKNLWEGCGFTGARWSLRFRRPLRLVPDRAEVPRQCRDAGPQVGPHLLLIDP